MVKDKQKMANTYVVIDLETTGLDNTYDKIIEVAAVKIRRGLIVEEFSSLIAIDTPLTEEISSLTCLLYTCRCV